MNVTDYLKAHSDLYKRARISNGKEYAFASMEDFVLAHGVNFAVTPDTFKGRRMQAKNCYGNCERMAARRTDLVYCEGYAMSSVGFPLMHAWLVTPEGNVIDPTWRDGTEYFGVPFSRAYRARALVKQTHYGLIDVPPTWPLLKGGVNFRHAAFTRSLVTEPS